MANKKEKQSFINSIVDALKNIECGGFFKSVIIAQAAVESSWGSSSLSKKYNNYFGMKVSKDWKGESVNLRTGEVFGGKEVTVKSNFKVYNSIKESIEDRNFLFRRLSRYAKVEKATTPEQQISEIRKAGYCTALNYESTIMTIIRKNNLTSYD